MHKGSILKVKKSKKILDFVSLASIIASVLELKYSESRLGSVLILQPSDFGDSTKMSDVCKNVFEAILKYGHDEDFDPEINENFLPTDAPAGSAEKIEILR